MEQEDDSSSEPLEFARLFRGIHPATKSPVFKFEDEQGDWFAISVKPELLRGLVTGLVEFQTSFLVDQAIREGGPESQARDHLLPPTETALLLAKSLEVIRWEQGGAVLMATTELGVPVQLALPRDLYESLRRKLAADPTMKKKKKK